MKEKVSIIVVTYNSPQILNKYFYDLYKNTTYPNIEFVVVDNSDRETTYAKEFVKKQKDSRIKYVKTTNNLGWGGACNLGAKHATGEYLFFANDDLYTYHKEWLTNLVKTYQERAKKKKKVVVIPTVVDYFEGKKEVYFGENIRVTKYGGFSFPLKINKIKVTELSQLIKKPKIYPWPSVGAFLLRREDYIQTKGYNEELFFLYHEDGEYALRLIQTFGFDIYKTTNAILFQEDRGAVHINFKRDSKKRKKLQNSSNANYFKMLLLHHKKSTLLVAIPIAILYYIIFTIKEKNYFGIFKSLQQVWKQRNIINKYRKQHVKIDFKNKTYFSTSFKEFNVFIATQTKRLFKRWQ